MNLPFVKMHGLGNDFVVLDGVRQTIHLTSALVSQMADRHFGIGFDQLLLIEPSRQQRGDFSYRIFNADGSEVGQCGNGARCVGQFLWETGLVSPQQKQIFLATQQRVLEVQPGAQGQITVNMGIPLWDPEQIPFQAPCRVVRYSLEVDDQALQFGAVNVGNPHAVLQVENLGSAPVAELGKKLQQHPRFPVGVNVGFMQYLDSAHIELRVYERGAGETLACGSGACAAVAIGRMQGLLADQVEVGLAGGKLSVSWQGEGHALWLTGPATTVFKGEWLIKSL